MQSTLALILPVCLSPLSSSHSFDSLHGTRERDGAVPWTHPAMPSLLPSLPRSKLGGALISHHFGMAGLAAAPAVSQEMLSHFAWLFPLHDFLTAHSGFCSSSLYCSYIGNLEGFFLLSMDHVV